MAYFNLTNENNSPNRQIKVTVNISTYVYGKYACM